MLTWLTLHDVEELPAARHVAYAIADLGRPLLELAREYTETWAALRRQRVPAKFVRELLDEELPEAEPLSIVRAWDSSRGPLVLVGEVGTAKSHALAWWALERHRAGELTHWESAVSWGSLSRDELRARHRELLTKPGLVLDDIGAGGLTDWTRAIVEGVIVERHAECLPTAVAMNADRQQTMAILGRRAVDRIIGEGGQIKVLKAKASLRRPPPEELDGAGRSSTWRRHKWGLDAVGCEIVSRGDDRGYEEQASYGDALAARLSRAGWIDEAERVRVHLELSVHAVVEAAQELAVQAESDPVLRLADGLLGRIRADAQREEDMRRRPTQNTGPTSAVFHRGDNPARRASNFVEGFDVPRLSTAQLRARGVWLRPDDGGLFEVRLGKERRTKAQVHPGDLKGEGFSSEADAWKWARTLFATPAEKVAQ